VTALTTSFVRHTVTISQATITAMQAGVVFIGPHCILGSATTSGWVEMQDVRLEEVAATGTIDERAATVSGSDFVATDTRTSRNTNHVICAVAITNDDTVSRTAQLTCSCVCNLINGIADSNVIYGWLRRSTDSYSVSDAEFIHTVQTGDYRIWPWSASKQDTIAAGATVTYYMVMKESYFTTDVTYSNNSLRVEIIKK
jgi:hypothetical protein